MHVWVHNLAESLVQGGSQTLLPPAAGTESIQAASFATTVAAAAPRAAANVLLQMLLRALLQNEATVYSLSCLDVAARGECIAVAAPEALTSSLHLLTKVADSIPGRLGAGQPQPVSADTASAKRCWRYPSVATGPAAAMVAARTCPTHAAGLTE